MAAISRGIRFEICYSQALTADARGRANFISNVTNLVRTTRGRGIFLSSEAKDALSLRGPADVVNLLNVWGLNNEKGMQGLGEIPRSVVVNEGIKRSGFRGVIDVVQVVTRETDDTKEENGSKKNKSKNQGQNQKRKGGDEESQLAIKRQAKKMKLASRGGVPEKK